MSATVLAIAIPINASLGQKPDPFFGTWVLNAAKSKYEGTALRSGTRTYSPAPNGYKYSTDVIDATGRKQHVEFTTAFDGKYHALTGSPNSDSIMVKRVNASTVESTQKRGAVVVIRTTRTVSKDGRTMTSTAKGTTPDGRAYTNVEVFEKK